MPSLELFNKKTQAYKNKGGSLIIIDDGMLDLTKDIISLFTVYSHHNKASIILVTHNLFLSSPIYRTIALNSHYVVLMRSARTMLQVRNLLHQIYTGPGKDQLFDMIEHIYNELFSYIVLDCHPHSLLLGVRTNIFSNETPMLTIIKNREL